MQSICTQCITPLDGPDTFRQCEECSCLKCNDCADEDFTDHLCGLCMAWCAVCEAPALRDMTCGGCAAVFCFECATDPELCFEEVKQNMDTRALEMTCARCPDCI